MALDEQSRALLDMQAQQHLADDLGETNKAMDFNDPVQERENFKQVALALARPTLPVGKVEDITVPSEGFDCPVRMYWPEGASADDKRACIVLLHGGGWVVGDIETHDAMARELCVLTDMVVASVEYRLAPEHPFPEGHLDCCAAVRWVRAHADEIGIDPDRVAITGESAGGNMAAGVAVAAMTDPSIKLKAQVLNYPSTDMRPNVDTPSRRELGLSGQFYPSVYQILQVNAAYCQGPGDRENPLCTQMLAEDVSTIAPAFVMTAGFDPLRDEGKLWVEKLQAAGVHAEYECLETTIHGYLNFGKALDISDYAFKKNAEKFKELLNA